MSLESAPCYYHLRDDGAPFKCRECLKHKPLKELRFTFTPDGRKSILCIDCLDPEWLDNAKDMGFYPDDRIVK